MTFLCQKNRHAYNIRYKEEIIHYEGGEVLAQVAQKSCGCHISGSAQDQAGWGFKQPAPVEGVGKR